ncbi:hypothetical protein D5043_20625 [Verminephrobacter eiseniae]|nr:hypothetical protein [Verminephrobacter eiseniae]MCW5286489.1 hypothetical protein [Verminephrobacter eiseniae]MCW5304788.1 hypothetical protein [Verminephrobacter eiseniae]
MLLVSRHRSSVGPRWPSKRIAALHRWPIRSISAARCALRCAPMAARSLRHLIGDATLAHRRANDCGRHGALRARQALPIPATYGRQRGDFRLALTRNALISFCAAICRTARQRLTTGYRPCGRHSRMAAISAMLENSATFGARKPV